MDLNSIYIELKGYNLFSADRQEERGGGVPVYLKDTFN